MKSTQNNNQSMMRMSRTGHGAEHIDFDLQGKN